MRTPPPGRVPRASRGIRRHGPCAGHAPTGRTDGPPGSPAPGASPHRVAARNPRAAHAEGHARGCPRRGAPHAMRLPHPHGPDRQADAHDPATILPPRVATDDHATGVARYAPSARPASRSLPTGRRSPAAIHRRCGPRLTPGVSCAAGRRVKGGGRRQEASTRQCACGRPVEPEERWATRSSWRLRLVVTPTGRSALPGKSRPAHEPRQRCQLHALVSQQP